MTKHHVAHPAAAPWYNAMSSIYSLPQEVIVNVCSFVLVKHPLSLLGWNKDKKTLACLARTCRTLSGPALTVLWHTLPDILPLLSTLPTDLCVRESMPTHRDERRQGQYIVRMNSTLQLPLSDQYQSI